MSHNRKSIHEQYNIPSDNCIFPTRMRFGIAQNSETKQDAICIQIIDDEQSAQIAPIILPKETAIQFVIDLNTQIAKL